MGHSPTAHLMYGYRLASSGHWHVKETDDFKGLALDRMDWAPKPKPHLDDEGDVDDYGDDEDYVSHDDIVDAANAHLRAHDLDPKTYLLVTDDENGGTYLIHGYHHTDWDEDKHFGPEHFQRDPHADLSLRMALGLLGVTPDQFEPRWILAATYPY